MSQSHKHLDDEQVMAELLNMLVRNNLEDLHAGKGPISDPLMKEINQRVRNAIYTGLHAARWQARSISARKYVNYHLLSIPDYWEPPKLLPGYRDALEPDMDGARPVFVNTDTPKYQKALSAVRPMLDRIAVSLPDHAATKFRTTLERYAIDRYLKLPTVKRRDAGQLGYLEHDLTERAKAMHESETETPAAAS